MASIADPKATGFWRRIDAFFDRFVKGWNPYDPEKLTQRERDRDVVQIEESVVRKRGARFVMIAVGAFAIWAVTAPLDAGSVMPGTVTVAGYRKAVQHPTGGVVSQVLVHEGSQVKQGDVLIRVNPLDTNATVANVEQEYINLLVSESRAKAELLGGSIRWDPELNKLNPAVVAEAKRIQQQFFDRKRAQYQDQIRAFQSQIAGLNGAIRSHQVQLGTLSQELNNVEALSKEGYVPKSQFNATLRDKSEKESALLSAQSEVARIRAQIAEVGSQMQSETAKELSELEKNRGTLASKLQAARFSQSLTEIRAPVTGTVVNLKVFTDGGVISGGEVLMEIVPAEGALIVETKVPPSSIDRVKVGQDVDIRFSAFNATTTPVVKGTVRSVGVDKLKAKPGEEIREGEDYYLAQIETTPESLRELGDKQLRPGMPADVIVKRGQRTFMSYLLKPLTDKFALAFKD